MTSLRWVKRTTRWIQVWSWNLGLKGRLTLRNWLARMHAASSRREEDRAAGALPDFVELQTPMQSLPAWHRWIEENPWATSPHYVAAMVDSIKRFGLTDPLHGFALPNEVSARSGQCSRAGTGPPVQG